LARYGTNYYGRATIAIRAKRSRTSVRAPCRIDVRLRERILSYTAEHGREILALGRDGDAKVASWAAHPGTSPALSLKSRMDTTRMEDVRVEQVVPLTDSTKREAGLGSRQRVGVVKLVRMPVMASFTDAARRSRSRMRSTRRRRARCCRYSRSMESPSSSSMHPRRSQRSRSPWTV
jgi:hypothetical protein